MNEIMERVIMNLVVFMQFSYEVSEERLLISELFKIEQLAHHLYYERLKVFLSKR